MPTTTASPLSRTLLWAIFGGSLAFPAIVATPRALAQDAPAARPPAGTLLIHRLEAQNHRDLAFERVAFAKAGEAFGSVLDAVADEGDNAIAAAARPE